MLQGTVVTLWNNVAQEPCVPGMAYCIMVCEGQGISLMCSCRDHNHWLFRKSQGDYSVLEKGLYGTEMSLGQKAHLDHNTDSER